MEKEMKLYKAILLKIQTSLVIVAAVMIGLIGLFMFYFVSNGQAQNQEWQYVALMTIIVTAAIIISGLSIFYFIIQRKLIRFKEILSVLFELTSRLKDKPLDKEHDEFDSLEQSMKQLKEHLKAMLNDLENKSKSISSSAHELSALTEQTFTTCEEIGNALSEISKGSVLQATDIESTSHKANDLQVNITNMTEESNVMIQLTEECAKAVRSGKESVNGLQAANKENANMLDQISLGITTLYQSVHEISGIVTTIDNISKQTNLLALNASIEAARAGEHGKGFAVVADEVRKLAEETNQATSQIQKMIQNIEKETESTVLVMAQTTEISNGLNQSVLATENEFNQISASISNIIAGISKLNTEIEIVSEHSYIILDSIQNISAVAEETTASTEEISASIDEQLHALGTINQSSQKLITLGDALRQSVRKISD
ncbi:methyl-accepting chemotaxis protein [Metabacillus sp. Hm71]|uniref:methyl-accepting chemotaxis protein n=1 Tax=Metabacillus sp. Hm71 TaxID=3450743 RepID=UPI003F438B31